MEMRALASHGGSAMLRERLCDSSDAYRAVFCTTCGNLAISDAKNKLVSCRLCKREGNFGIVTIPYVFKVLIQLLNGVGLSMLLKLRPVGNQ